jgi:putative SOS response-associated peptidase YedK
MSRRYVSPDQISIDQDFDLVRSGWEFPVNFNAAPSQAVPVIRVVEGQPDPVLMSWGFGEHDTANLPVEALRAGADDHGLLAQGQRCLLPALGFYVWRTAPGGARKPYYVQVEDQAVFAFAGLWERESCTLITLPANPLLAELDDVERRMPAILSREMRDIWLYGSVANAAAGLVGYPAERLVVYPVSARVDSLDNNDETLIEPLETNVD